MRRIGPLMIAAALVPLFWAGALRAAEASSQDQPNNVNVERNDGYSYWDEGMAPPAPSPSTALTPGSITGLVVGTNCWLSRGLEGDQYRDSAIACARNGTPLAILTDDGWLVYPFTIGTDGNAKPDLQLLMPYAEQRVTASGLVVGRGMTRGVIIDSVAVAKTAPKRPRTFGVKQVANKTIRGRVVDLGCWLAQGNPGTSDPTCVGVCAAGGDPLVIVGSNGYVYYPVTLTNPSSPVGTAMLSGYCAQEVLATGTIIARGYGRAIVIDKVTARPVK
jgi:hypothetical protein